MKILFNILFILILIIFLPIPIKLSLYFDKSGYDIKIYKFSIIEKIKKKKKQAPEVRQKKEERNLNSKKKDAADYAKERFNLISFLKERIDLSILYTNFRDSNFKPRLRVNGFLNYSLGDPMNTAVSYGAINMILPIFYRGILIFFRTKKFKFDINPQLESESHLNTKLNCIIFFSFAHIIYMLFLIFKSILDTREVNPL